MLLKKVGIISPDVYFLPRFLSLDFNILMQGEKIIDGLYKAIFIELNAGIDQLTYLSELCRFKKTKVIIIPGPPELISARLTFPKVELIKEILNSGQVIGAYSNYIKDFFDGFAGKEVSTVIPWCFDFDSILKISYPHKKKSFSKINILLNAPLRFTEMTRNYPFILNSIISDVFNGLNADEQKRICFRTFVYSNEDKKYFFKFGYDSKLPVIIERKKGFMSFVKFVNKCDAVINLTKANILGRITYISASLNKPGIFSINSELNEKLYPGSTLDLFNTKKLRNLVTTLIHGALENKFEQDLMPNIDMAKSIGDFKKNSEQFKSLLFN